MMQSTLSVSVDSEDKKNFEAFCRQAGLNTSVAINMFVKTVLREQKIPFEIKVDPFFSDENLARLEKSVRQLTAGGGTPHELFED